MSMTSPTAYVTPPALARRYGVSIDKVLGWIRRGELRAINLADRLGGQPRWRISEADIAAFELARSSRPEPKAPKGGYPRGLPVVEKYYK